MSSKQITIPDIGTVTLYKRRDSRSIRLSVTPAGEVRVTLPAWAPYGAGAQFVRSKADWISTHRAKQPRNVLATGARIGKAHRLNFTADPSVQKVSTRLLPNEIRILFPVTFADHTHPAVQKAAQSAGLRALRKEAKALLPQRLRTMAAKTGLTYADLHIKLLKSRWGSCSSEREITLSLFLMQLPWQLIDYVIVHELTHTKIMQHGPAFWAELEQHMPAAKQLRKEINQHHPVLTPAPDATPLMH